MDLARPLLLTMGDPVGVGPELALRGVSWAREHQIPLAIVGAAEILGRVGARLGLEVPATVPSDRWAERPTADCVIDCVTAHQRPLVSALQPGQVNALSGALSLQAVEYAIAETIAGRSGGVVTCPIHKTAWQAAGAKQPGHTELLGERTGASHQCMMLAAPTIRCALVTVHVGITEVSALITQSAVLRTIELAATAVRRTIQRAPRVAVLGLNPHAGEAGLFGNQEEERAIIPAIAAARQAGWDVRGPLPPDTAFLPEIRDSVDLYICMYHDQGLIPLKALAFDEAVNVTLGLPIVRTSVDHGTALDLAWRGIARPHSLYAAIEMAARLVEG